MSPIPKRFIQTAKHAALPLRNQAAVANLKLLHPDYEYLFFDNQAVERFFDRDFPEYRPVFDSFRYNIQRYDFFRYLAVYHYGGFYFDIDVFLASSLAPLLDAGCVFPFEGLTFSRLLREQYDMDWQIGNYGFGAASGDPFLKAVIDNCVKAQNDDRWASQMTKGVPWLSQSEFYVLNTTGPGLLSRTFAENPDLARSLLVLFPEDVCDVRTWNRFGDIGVHLMDGDWRPAAGRLRRRIAQILEVRKMERLIRESRRSGSTRRHGPAQPIAPAEKLE